ncbi:hypothetical protein C8J56DRAFT_1063083 [Mycena floridula]|nr:hypothetical protein C8J56DRAFT_1063083 [Mycena floridula]
MACQKKTDNTSNPPKKCGSADTTSPIPAISLARGYNSTKGEGLVKKVAKVPKNAVYALITKAVFTVDADSTVQEDYMVNPAKHGPTVNNFFIQLCKQYHEANTKIRRTGAGLEYSQIRECSNI